MARFFLRACFLHNYWDTTAPSFAGRRQLLLPVALTHVFCNRNRHVAAPDL